MTSTFQMKLKLHFRTAAVDVLTIWECANLVFFNSCCCCCCCLPTDNAPTKILEDFEPIMGWCAASFEFPVSWWKCFYMEWHSCCIARRAQSMKIEHRKTNRSIDINRYQLVNWYWLILVNRWSVDSHIKLSANYIDFHQLAMLIWLLFHLKVIESCLIDCSSISNINRLIIIDWYRLA